MNERDINTIVAALRIFQNKLSGDDHPESYNDVIRCYFIDCEIKVPTDGEIDRLIDRIFCKLEAK